MSNDATFIPIWCDATENEKSELLYSFQRTARHRGLLPCRVCVMRDVNNIVRLSAMLYVEPGKYDRWGIQQHPSRNIEVSWSELHEWVRALVDELHYAIEIYPNPKDVLNTAPIRWFWILPGPLPREYDLRSV